MKVARCWKMIGSFKSDLRDTGLEQDDNDPIGRTFQRMKESGAYRDNDGRE